MRIKRSKRYESLEEVFASQCHPTNAKREAAVVFTTGYGPSQAAWAGGFKTLGAYAKAVRSGGAKLAPGALGAVECIGEIPKVAGVRRRQRWREDGDEYNPSRAWEGDVEHAFLGTQREVVLGGRQVHHRILVATTAGSGVTPEAMVWRGAVAAILTDALESAGRRVEVVAYNYCNAIIRYEPAEDATWTEFVVKHFDEAMELPHLAAVLANAGILRVAMFAAKLSWIPSATDMGSPIHDAPPPEFAGESDVVVENIWSREEAIEFLRTTAARFA